MPVVMRTRRFAVASFSTREAYLALAIFGIVLLTFIGMSFLPGVIAGPDDDPRDPGRVGVEEVSIGVTGVSGETVTLDIDTRLRHMGGVSENVTMEVRATRLDTGLRTTSTTVTVGSIEGDRERAVTEELQIPREGAYRIDIIVYEDERRIGGTAREIRGVDSLTPVHAQTTVEFHRFAGETDDRIPVIGYSIDATSNNQTTLSVHTFIRNTGDSVVGGHELEIHARQADSNIIADRATISIDEIPPGQTARPTVELTVPQGYNYYLDGLLWMDGVLVDDATAAANLDPARQLTVNETREPIGLEVRDFEDTDRPREPRETPAPEDVEQPGFGVALAVLSVLIGTFMFARRYIND